MFGYFFRITVLALSTAAVACVSPFPENSHSRLIDTNGAKILVRVDGHETAVVLLHGFGDALNPAAEMALSPGSYYSEPARVAHVEQTHEQAVMVYISDYGSTGTVYVSTH